MDIIAYLKKTAGQDIKTRVKYLIDNGVTTIVLKDIASYINREGICIDIGIDSDSLMYEFEKQISKILHEHSRQQHSEELKKQAESLNTFISSFLEKSIDEKQFTNGLTEQVTRIYNFSEYNKLPESFSIDDFFQPEKEIITLDLFPGLEIQNGAITYIGARPGVGKTLTLINMARELLQKGYHVEFYTFEEHSRRIMYKLMLSLFGATDKRIYTDGLEPWNIEQKKYRTPLKCIIGESKDNRFPPDFLKDQYDIICKWLKTGLLKVYFSPGDYFMLANCICRNSYGIVFIDYIQKIPTQNKTTTRQIQIQEISNHLVRVAVNMGKPLIIGAQLTRKKNKEGKEVNTLKLSDFRESGDIEQDANIALGILEVNRNNASRQLEYHILKNRDGDFLNPFSLTHHGNYWYLAPSNKENNNDKKENEVPDWRQKTLKIES